MRDVLFCICPGSSGDSLGAYHPDTKNIYVDGRAIAYYFDETVGAIFVRAVSQVITHETIHMVLDECVGVKESILFDNLNQFRDEDYLLQEAN
jgi:hypothetical protein